VDSGTEEELMDAVVRDKFMEGRREGAIGTWRFSEGWMDGLMAM